ncbi:glycosyltransferase family 25 protein [Rhizobium sp. CFBP 8762]|nr:glycosyltransferase family 25 protein [Rhizobium sp. CFBP 8762]MBD8553969.1 glycosyltransferase family 25 protein [Rhizobium sp. CFBP 8762]
MRANIYIINLDRSEKRWQRVSTMAQQMGLPLTRIPAVDGACVPVEDRIDTDTASFLRLHGHVMMPGEYGCYRSHLNVMQAFLQTPKEVEIAIVMEDDAELRPDIIDRALAIHDALPQAGIVKLLNNRARGFRQKLKTTLGDRVGRCLHGPQGSAACYYVTRTGAASLLSAIATMKLPYDIALERGWETGVETFTVQHNVTTLGPYRRDTAIGNSSQYRKTKIPRLKRVTTHLFRARDYLCRIAYALRM